MLHITVLQNFGAFLGFDFIKCLLQVVSNVINVFNAQRYSQQAWFHSGRFLLLLMSLN
jgi:hypothetical protein